MEVPANALHMYLPLLRYHFQFQFELMLADVRDWCLDREML